MTVLEPCPGGCPDTGSLRPCFKPSHEGRTGKEGRIWCPQCGFHGGERANAKAAAATWNRRALDMKALTEVGALAFAAGLHADPQFTQPAAAIVERIVTQYAATKASAR